ncbi:conserved hypothetical protein [Synechococcus sp. PCC 7335]|uniref:ASCH domain-containing protein n=1 Tax=Synechococcus sp. (strain ATCC 29403 / PCC 7335) TaxID=91464 RepID=UPI00017EC020|nr:ASCH domain-containing protein [Synechococcus sp. PCC 7335]EDX87675.1 conserved hypothetical protein [Synechococcus sp. PCC 7335]
MNKVKIDQYWQSYLGTLPSQQKIDRSYLIDQFGDSPALTNELTGLVLNRVKTATCSALWEWEAEQSPLPKVGSKTVILDSAQNPACIVETTEIIVCPFNQVDRKFAYDEGEDNRSLESWRREHWKYFSRVLPKIGKTPTPTMPLVCERFQVLYSV